MDVQLSCVIDTYVISEMMQPRPAPRVAAFLDSIIDEGLGISSITIWEILSVIGYLDPGKRRENLAVRF